MGHIKKELLKSFGPDGSLIWHYLVYLVLLLDIIYAESKLESLEIWEVLLQWSTTSKTKQHTFYEMMQIKKSLIQWYSLCRGHRIFQWENGTVQRRDLEEGIHFSKRLEAPKVKCDTSTLFASSQSIRKYFCTRNTPRKVLKKPSLFIAEGTDERLSYYLAIKGENIENWPTAENNKTNSLEKHRTWVLVWRENVSNVLRNKWDFR